MSITVKRKKNKEEALTANNTEIISNGTQSDGSVMYYGMGDNISIYLNVFESSSSPGAGSLGMRIIRERVSGASTTNLFPQIPEKDLLPISTSLNPTFYYGVTSASSRGVKCPFALTDFHMHKHKPSLFRVEAPLAHYAYVYETWHIGVLDRCERPASYAFPQGSQGMDAQFELSLLQLGDSNSNCLLLEYDSPLYQASLGVIRYSIYCEMPNQYDLLLKYRDRRFVNASYETLDNVLDYTKDKYTFTVQSGN